MANSFMYRLLKRAGSSIFSHRNLPYRKKSNQLIAGSFGLIVMVCPCSTLLAALLAANPLLTPMDEGLVEKKGTKDSDLLSELINLNALSGRYPLLTPNSTDFIFAMNPGDMQGAKRKYQEEPQGAGAQQMQPLAEFLLPAISREQIAEIIRTLNPGLSEETIIALLSNIPETPPIDNLTIAGMIQQVQDFLGIKLDGYQDTILEALSRIQDTESPVKLDNSQDQQNLAYLMLAYYTAKYSSGVSRQSAYRFFNSFLLHAAEMAGISRLYQQKDKLLGKKKPIKDKEVLKRNVATSKIVFSALKSLETERIYFLHPFEDHSSGADQANTLLMEAAKLLNNGIDRNGMLIYERHRRSAQRMWRLINACGDNELELVAWNNQFLNLIDIISQMLDPFSAEYAGLNALIVNMEDYFRKSGKSTAFYSGSNTRRELLAEIKEVAIDAKLHPENQNHELFKEMIEHIRTYLTQQLHLTFTNEHHRKVILQTLRLGFRDLLKQSYYLLAVFSNTAIASNVTENEIGKKERKKKHLQERIGYIKELVEWFDYYLDIPNCDDSSEYESSASESSESESSESESCEAESCEADSNKSDSSDSFSSDSDS
ncbi:hypothetical protein [Endozoicomonas sp. 4G]|uniref:hypothetical protein n=1 Tax=Endozoicomonas sp. 4G TaxID=2872754 RepID=UPI002078EC6E|nr:hypothetical protein [Endozoicomonas sp. 4G]